MESHLSYPVLCYFRALGLCLESREQSRSCAATELLYTGVKAAHPPATAGGTDCVQQRSVLLRQSCALVIVGIGESPAGQARLTLAMARHAIVDIAQVFRTAPRRHASKKRIPVKKSFMSSRSSLEYEVEGKPPMILKAGEVLFMHLHSPLRVDRRTRESWAFPSLLLGDHSQG